MPNAIKHKGEAVTLMGEAGLVLNQNDILYMRRVDTRDMEETPIIGKHTGKRKDIMKPPSFREYENFHRILLY